MCMLQALGELDQEFPEAIVAEEGAGMRESSYQALQVASACKLHHDVQGSSLEEGSDVGDDMWVR